MSKNENERYSEDNIIDSMERIGDRITYVVVVSRNEPSPASFEKFHFTVKRDGWGQYYAVPEEDISTVPLVVKNDLEVNHHMLVAIR